MRIQVDPSALCETKWHEYAVRFLSGGLITVIAGIIAKHFGPVVGGLFLAFPAIFPASATLIEKHERKKKEEDGLNGTVRAAQAVSMDAAGAAIGSLGLVIFAIIVWRLISNHSAWVALSTATFLWLGVSVLLWQLRKHN